MQVDFGDQGESEHNLHLSANPHQHAHPHSHYEHPRPDNGPPYSPFRHPGGGAGGGGGGGGGGGVPAIDPALHQSTGASRNVHTPMSAVPHQAQSNHLLQPDNAGHLSHGFYGDMRSSQTPQPLRTHRRASLPYHQPASRARWHRTMSPRTAIRPRATCPTRPSTTPTPPSYCTATPTSPPPSTRAS
ncbi:hypothetical protein P3342_009803 [Pyrenophora teres f. teres]|nr:hypothetical protein P3342_009803 [Pyrenophora teres f. teres]